MAPRVREGLSAFLLPSRKCGLAPLTLSELIPPTPLDLFLSGDHGAEVLALHLGDEVDGDILGAGGLAFADVGAVAESFFVHLGNHALDAAGALGVSLRQQREL